MSRLAQAVGASAEQLVDLGLRRYHAEGKVAWSATYPEVLFLGPGQARATGEALPDRCLAVRALGGRLLWLEVKTWKAKDRHTLRQRLHQLEQMRDFAYNGGALGVYLVAWHWHGTLDWRIYPIANISVENGGVLFLREEGLAVDDAIGFPDWLPVILQVVLEDETR